MTDALAQNLTIRLARTGEEAALEGLQRRASLAWEEYREALLAHPEAIGLPPEQIEAGWICVAELAGALVGFSVVIPRGEAEPELDGLFVEPGFWGKGIGRRLVREAELSARRRGAAGLTVVANPLAVGFYKAVGFDLLGDCETQFGPALIMRRALLP